MPSRRVLKSVAHNFGHATIQALHYHSSYDGLSGLVQAANETGEKTLTIDILSETAAPAPLVTGPVQATVSRSRWFFAHLLLGAGVEIAFVRTARMTITLDIAEPIRWSVAIEDDRGRTWTHDELRGSSFA